MPAWICSCTELMMQRSGMSLQQLSEKRRQREVASILLLDKDILCIIFCILDLFDVVRCSVVCKSWNSVIKNSRLLHALYCMQHDVDAASNQLTDLQRPLSVLLEDLAMRRHRSALVEGNVHVDQWKGHTTRIHQCRMKMGMILTSESDKVMRLWSSESYKCLKEYSLADVSPLVDFDFDESKIVGLVGTRICIWRRDGSRSVFPAREGTFAKGLCMRYMDPEAAVGCEDGTVRVFDMYSRTCSRIIRMHSCPVTCIALGEDLLIMSGSSLGSVTISGLSADQTVATLKSIDRTGIKTLCYNPSSQLVFAGSASGYVTCWDLRKMKSLWETRVSPNVLYSMQYLQNDTLTLVAGGIDGVLRIIDQKNGEVLSRYAMYGGKAALTPSRSFIERKRVKKLAEDASVANTYTIARPPIKCLAVGMKKVVTIHNDRFIRMWKFDRVKCCVMARMFTLKNSRYPWFKFIWAYALPCSPRNDQMFRLNYFLR